MGRLRERGPDETAWRCQPGLSQAARAVEQDRAAGTRENRLVRLAGGSALASVALRRKPGGRRIYAYLRWSNHGRTVERYICEVNQKTRAGNLAYAWRQVARRRLTDAVGPPPAPAVHVSDAPLSGPSWASSPAIRAVMRANKSRDTRPERAVRSAVHALGLRYRVGIRPIPGVRRTADLVFPRAKVAVFVDGCFWHGCPEHYRPAKRNAEFWTAKIDGNVARDADTDARLKLAGWRVIRAWEHEQPAAAAARIRSVVRGDMANGPE